MPLARSVAHRRLCNIELSRSPDHSSVSNQQTPKVLEVQNLENKYITVCR